MKKFVLLFAMALGSVALYSQTLISYGNNSVSKDEFLRAYNKNKTPVTDKEKSLREYITLYSNFKLKVKAAEVLRMDTLGQLQVDMDNFRRQVEDNYMSDEKALQSLMEEAFGRSQQDLHVLHFSIPVDAAATPEDTLKIYQRIQSLYNELRSGKDNYDAIVANASARSGDLGFVTVFSLPYEYENIVYSLKPEEISKPYRSKNAWHIFKLAAQRKSAGKWKVAQILFSFPPDADAVTKATMQHLADSVYALLKGGADFGELAQTYSNDKLTYLTGGELPEFGTGKFDQSFEKEIFGLTKDGDISKPFSTSFGIHIVKRLGYTPMPSDRTDASLQYELKQKLMQDGRISAAKEKFARDIVSRIGYKRSDAVKEADLLRYADSIMVDPSIDFTDRSPISNKTIITFHKGSLKGSDWLKFVKDYKTSEQYKGESNKELWNKYVTIASLDYYKKHLEEFNADFKFQMQEFKEGNMLFEIMERNVWGKASSDSTGLLNYYKEHKDKYKWAASADVLIASATSEKMATAAMAAFKEGKAWKEIGEMHPGELQVDSGRYELSQLNESNSNFTPTKDGYSLIIKNADGTATFIKYLNLYPADQQRNFEESRGLVINDYQNVLEQKWLAELQKKYPVKVNETVFKSLLK